MALTGFPGDAPPPVGATTTPDAAQMPSDLANRFKSLITASRDYIKPVIEQGKKNVLRQKQKFFEKLPAHDSVTAPDDFFLSQQKIAKLFYKVPEVQLSGKTPEAEPIAPLFQAVLNEQLDAEHINIAATIDEMLTDLITAVGFGACKIGYNATVDTQTKLDPLTQQPMIGPDGITPLTEDVLIHEAYECSRIPPGRMLFAPEFIRSDFDTSPYIGFTFIEDVPVGTPHARTSRLNDDEDLLSKPPTDAENTSRTYLLVDAIWFKASLFNPDVKNPEEIWEFEWVRDAPEPRKYRKCPYKNFPGFPVKVLTTRYISDSALPPSDTTITRNTIDAKSRLLSIELLHNQRTLPQNAVDTSRLDGDVLQKLGENILDAYVGFGMPITEDLIRPIIKGQLPQEHYALMQTLNRTIAASWSIGAAQAGAKEEGTHTATEINSVDVAMDTRLGYEENKAAVFFVTKQVRPIAALLQQYGPQSGGYARVLDANGTMQLRQWTSQQFQGHNFAFKIKINSQARPDSSADLKRTTDWINYSAKSPFVNQKRNWILGAEAFGLDPFGGPMPLIVDPPPPQPEAATLAPLKVEDLFVAMTNAIVLETLINYKVPFPTEIQQTLAALKALPPVASAPQNPLTPGSAPEADVLSKHVDTGKLPGGGAMVADGIVPTNALKPRVM